MSETLSLSSIDSRVLELLSQGATSAQTASALGISESRVSQLLSDERFAEQLSSNRFQALAKHNERDSHYDRIEDKLLKQLEQVSPMLMQPEKIARVLQIVNQAKRRGASSVDHIHQQQTVIQLHLPTKIVNRFQVNGQNQVTQLETEDGKSQSMVTIQSGQMKRLAAAATDIGHKMVINNPSEVQNVSQAESTLSNERKLSKSFAKFGL
jgi:predicted transcriptional regulator